LQGRGRLRGQISAVQTHRGHRPPRCGDGNARPELAGHAPGISAPVRPASSISLRTCKPSGRACRATAIRCAPATAGAAPRLAAARAAICTTTTSSSARAAATTRVTTASRSARGIIFAGSTAAVSAPGAPRRRPSTGSSACGRTGLRSCVSSASATRRSRYVAVPPHRSSMTSPPLAALAMGVADGSESRPLPMPGGGAPSGSRKRSQPPARGASDCVSRRPPSRRSACARRSIAAGRSH